MKKIIIFVAVFLITFNIQAQANDVEALAYNVSFGAVFGTIGSLINKKKEDKIGKTILRASAGGAFGGLLTFGSKKLLREAYINEDWKYIWGAKILNAAGTSIKENATLNRNLYENWNINFGFTRIEMNTKGKFRINYKIMPVALAYTIDAFLRFDNFELNKSLETGEFIFSTKLNNAKGATLAGYVVLNKNSVNDYSTVTHEITHIYQSNDFSILNAYYSNPISNFKSKYRTVNFVNKHTYLDFHYLPLRLLYNYETKTAINYYDNFLEHEAGYYSNTLH